MSPPPPGSEPIKISGTRQREAKPPATYVCNICSNAGHWRVNCPTIRAHGRQEVFGKERARKFRSSDVPGAQTTDTCVSGAEKPSEIATADRSSIAQPCDDAEAQRVAVALPAAGEELPRWDYAELSTFPMRATCLQQNVLVTDLLPALQLRLWAYVRRLVMPRNPELVRALAACCAACPTAMRVKELCESIEAYAVIEAFLVTCTSDGSREITSIADLACGHGLVGVLLAYRFPHKRVFCVDLIRRSSFDAIRAAFEREGRALEGEPRSLHNLSMIEGSLDCPEVRT